MFGKRAKGVKAFGDQLASDLGRSKVDIAGFLAEAQDLFVPLGFNPKDAEQISKTLTRLGIDLASFNNRADADVIGDLQSAMTGSSEVMKKYGVIVNETAVKQEALNRGWDAANLSEQQKAMARLAIIMRGTTAAQGDAERSGGSYANTMKRLQASLKDVRATLGAGLLPILARWFAAAANGVRQVEAWAVAHKPLLKIIAKVLIVSVALGAAVAAAGGTMFVAGVAMGLVAKGIGAVLLALKLVPIAIGLVTTTFGGLIAVVTAIASPLGIAIALIAGVAGYVVYASGALEWFGEAWHTLSTVAMKALGGIRDALMAGDLKAAMQVLWTGLNLIWTRGVTQLTAAWSGFRVSVLNILSGLWTKILQGGVAVVSGLQIAWNAMWSAFERQTQRNGSNLLKTYLRLKGKLTGEDVSQQIADVDQITNATNKASTDNQQVVDEQIVSVQMATIGQLGADQKNAEQKRLDATQETFNQLTADRIAAESEFNDALGRARDAREQHEQNQSDEKQRREDPDLTPPDIQGLIDRATDGVGNAAKLATASIGGFNAAAFDRLFAANSNTEAKETANNTREMARQLKRIANHKNTPSIFATS